MKPMHALSTQRGVATIFVAMVLLIFITLMVITAFSMSSMNLRAVGNVQTRGEAIAAAEKSIELAIDTTFWNPPDQQEFDIDIDYDDVNDYEVVIASPVCVRATKAILQTASSVTLPGFSSANAWNTIWVLDAVSSHTTLGTRVRVRQGVRVLMSDTDRTLYCPS